jgi:hypothetical protein
MFALNFEDLLARLQLSTPWPILPDDNKWGFFSALLDANVGDDLQTGGLVLMTTHPRVEYRQSERLWMANCNQIMVGNRTLWDYLYGVLTGPTYHDIVAEYWRDTSPSYYILHGSNGSTRYVDGSLATDIPDFHSLDISVGLGNLGPPGVGSANVSFVDDRFGNQYITFPDVTIDQSIIEYILKHYKKNASLSFPVGVAYSEGYACIRTLL